MEIEIEAKFTDIDPEALRTKLKTAGAILLQPERMLRRRQYDYPDRSLEAKYSGWIRVRDEGHQTTLAYKQLNDRSLHGTQEVSLVVDSFEKASSFLTSIGMVLTSYQETKRENWQLGEVEITIDTWPWIPPFCELEGPSEEALKEVAKAIGFDWSLAMYGSVETVYQIHYDVTEHTVDNWKEITFKPVPAEIEAKRVHKNTQPFDLER